MERSKLPYFIWRYNAFLELDNIPSINLFSVPMSISFQSTAFQASCTMGCSNVIFTCLRICIVAFCFAVFAIRAFSYMDSDCVNH